MLAWLYSCFRWGFITPDMATHQPNHTKQLLIDAFKTYKHLLFKTCKHLLLEPEIVFSQEVSRMGCWKYAKIQCNADLLWTVLKTSLQFSTWLGFWMKELLYHELPKLYERTANIASIGLPNKCLYCSWIVAAAGCIMSLGWWLMSMPCSCSNLSNASIGSTQSISSASSDISQCGNPKSLFCLIWSWHDSVII